MAEIGDRKLYLGPRLRMLRRELGINQTRMAEELGVSASYLNHLERNQRPLTAQMLLRLASTYDIDIRDFVSGGSEAATGNLHEIFADPLVRDIGTPRHEVIEVAENYPGVAEAVTRLYRALCDLRQMPDAIERIGQSSMASTPIEWMRGYFEQKRNHLPEIETACETLSASFPADPVLIHAALQQALESQFAVSVRIVPETALSGALRHYDFHRKRLMLSERLHFSGRLFAIAYQYALLALAAPVAAVLAAAAPPDDQSRDLLRTALLNYAAAALIMPYERFRAAAETTRYDLPLLGSRFGASFEQVAHRLTSLGRNGARGIAFFMLKIDSAGIVSKRFAGDSFPFARFGGPCPRWNLHQSFTRPGEIVTQVVETTDGQRFFTMARAMRRDMLPESESLVAIGLGCELRLAGKIVHADAHDIDRPHVVGIGPTCHICERLACPDRSLPPVTRTLEIHPFQRTAAPYPFRRV